MKVQRLFLRNVRNIKSLDLDFRDPFTGKPMSRIVLVGANGTGKTTILECLFGLISTFSKYAVSPPSAQNKLQDIEVSTSHATHLQAYLEFSRQLVSVYFGNTDDYLKRDDEIKEYVWIGSELIRPDLADTFDVHSPVFNTPSVALSRLIHYTADKEQSGYSSILYYPHDRYLPAVQMDKLDLVPPKNPWAYRYKPSDKWDEVVEKYLFWLNYLDLEDRDKGKPADRFSKAVELVNSILEDKRITRVEKARVIVENKNTGETHGLDALSSGEKQLALLLVDISRRVDHESTILIDEPEISLHSAWQRGLIAALDKIIEQYDAQVILATHSVEVGTMVLPYEVISLNDLGMPLGKWEPEKEIIA